MIKNINISCQTSCIVGEKSKQSRQFCSLLECHFQLVAGKNRCVVSVVSVCEIFLRY